jgi:hypothetical protein
MKRAVHFMLLMSIVQMVFICLFISIPELKDNEPKKYALLIGGGVTEWDNLESFYKNIKYVSNTLIKLGYHDEDIKILFYEGSTSYHPIVEGNASKKNFINELGYLGKTIDSNDSLIIFRSGHGMVELIYEKFPTSEHGLGIESTKCVGTEAVMKFPDGNLSYLEFQEILGRIKGKQIVVILNQCFSGQFN